MKPNDRSEAVNLEEQFFAKENARLLDKLRAHSDREQQREMLARVVKIHDPAFLDRLLALGIEPQTAMALRLVPLVFVAWADGTMDDSEREAIMKAATEQGMAGEEIAQKVLKDWLQSKPEAKLLQLWKDYVAHLWTFFTSDEQDKMRQNLLESAEKVASSAGGFLGIASISNAERKVIEELKQVVV